MDIGIIDNAGTFKLRATGVIVKDGKMLVCRSRRFDGFVFCGGHVMLGENSRDAIVREAREELGFDVEIKKLICINENLFPLEDKIAHEISFYYLLEPVIDIPMEDYEYVEIEDGQEFVHKYSWVSLEEARNFNVRPDWVADMILQGRENYYYLSDQVNRHE